MRRTLILITVIIVCFAFSFVAKMAFREEKPLNLESPAASSPKHRGGYERIVSLAPSITEDLYTLGLMDRVVGVTRFCDYPPEALDKTKIGGYTDPNYEAIIALKPDLIIMLAEHEEPRKRLGKLGFDIVSVNHKSIEGILESIEAIGDACGVLPKAKAVTKHLMERMERIQEKTACRSRQRPSWNLYGDSISDTERAIKSRPSFREESWGLFSMDAGGLLSFRRMTKRGLKSSRNG